MKIRRFCCEKYDLFDFEGVRRNIKKTILFVFYVYVLEMIFERFFFTDF